MERNSEAWDALAKGVIAWLGVIIGGLTLSKLVMLATLVFTSLQTFVLVRDKILRGRVNEKA